MTGAASRAKGHRAERDVAKWLRGVGYTDACTTRSKLGHDGSRQPGDVDVCDGTGLVVEVKHVARSAWPTWLAQAREQAQERPWVVVRRTDGVTDPGRWVAAVDCEAMDWVPPSEAMVLRAGTGHPDRWLDVTRFAFWTHPAVVFCSFADAIALHQAANPDALLVTVERAEPGAEGAA